jgi:putative ABC transport system permease protein
MERRTDMGIWRLVRQEIGYRRLNFAEAMLGVLVATVGLIGPMTVLRAYSIRAEKRLAAMEKDYKKQTLKYGFNVRVIPSGQDRRDFFDKGYATKTMDQSYARRLADSDILTTIRHLTPTLKQKILWKEQKQNILLIGAHGETPLKERERRKPAIIKIIPEGKIDLGYDLWTSIGLKPKQEVVFLGRKFAVRNCLARKDSQDDIGVWMDLQAAQELTDKIGKINEIQAVDCTCAKADVDKIQAELSQILPNTQVLLDVKMAVARSKARLTAQKTRVAELKDKQSLVAVTAAFLSLGAAILISLLAFGNVRQRTMEIGVLRAIGLSSRQILSVFLVRSLIIGLVGAIGGVILGGCLGVGVAVAWGEITELSQAYALFSPLLLGLVVLCAPVLSALVSWPPSMLASRQDPAIVLSRE